MNIINWLRYRGILSLKPAFEVVCVYSEKPSESDLFKARSRFDKAVKDIPSDGYNSRNFHFSQKEKGKTERRKRRQTKKKARKRNRKR